MLLTFTSFLIGVNIHILHHPQTFNLEMTTVFQTILANFTGALLLALQSRAKAPNGNTAPPPVRTEPPQPPGLEVKH